VPARVRRTPGATNVALYKRTRLVEWQTRKSREQRARISVPKVAEEIRLDVPFGEELLIAPEAGLTGRKEFLVHLCVVEAGERTTIKPKRAAMIRYAP
jgi:hypothetical protein